MTKKAAKPPKAPRFGYQFQSASGQSDQHCCVIGYRFEEKWGFRPDAGESWVVVMRPEECRVVHVVAGWYTSLWCSDADVVHVTSADGHVITGVNLDDAEPTWKQERLGASLSGIWGLDDRNVFAWGIRGNEEGALFRSNGRRWKEIDSPGDITAMHGLAPDLIYAVGRDGLIARFDGRRWHEQSRPTAEQLTSVFVVSADEVYAVGAAGSLLEGTAHEWARIAMGPETPGQLRAVAKFGGTVWVGAGSFGLYKRVGKSAKLTLAKDNIWATSIDVRGEMLLTCWDAVVATKDGKSWLTSGEGFLEEVTSDRPPLW